MFGKREPPVLPDFSGGLQSRGTLAHESEEGELQRPRLPHVAGPGAARPPPGLTVPPASQALCLPCAGLAQCSAPPQVALSVSITGGHCDPEFSICLVRIRKLNF